MALTLSHYRFGINELAESTHGWHAAEDANPAQGVIAVDVPFLLRFCVQANATGLSNVDNEFQCRKNGGAWQNITTTSTVVKAVAVTPLTEGGNCTKRLSGTGTFESSGAGQTEDGVSGGAANDIVASGNSETECGLQIVGADVAHGDLVEFRLTRDGGVLLDTYSVVPALTVSKLVTTSGDGSSAGVGAATAVGLALFLAIASASGVATAEAVGTTAGTVESGDGSAAGTATAAGVGVSTAASAAASDGTASPAGVGASTASSTAASAGVATATGTGTSTSAATGASSGVATPAAVGVSTALSTGAVAGTSTAAAVGTTAGSTEDGVAQAEGASTALGVGASTCAASAQAGGTVTALAVGEAAIRIVGGRSSRHGPYPYRWPR